MDKSNTSPRPGELTESIRNKEVQNIDGSIFFTILIPTRERVDTLVHTIRTVLEQDYEEFEVIVSDNASLDGTKELVESINSSRLRYINCGKRVSMSANWEFALDHVLGDWVTVLGDDDGLVPGALRTASEIINKTGTSAIRSNGCSYSWPSLLGTSHGRLTMSLNSGFQRRNSSHMLQEVMDGRRAYNELPVLYNGGFINMSLIFSAKERTGKFFQSMTPDVYSGIVLSHLTEDYIYCYEPLAINGASVHSNGTAFFERVKGKRQYDPATKFWNENNIPFHDALPLTAEGRPVRSIPILVYEAFLQAKEFHSLKDITTSHQRQLKIALMRSGPDHKEIEEWAKSFAQAHDIDLEYPAINWVKAGFKKIERILRLFRILISSYRIYGAKELPLRNVYEASLVAGLIKVIRPSIAQKALSICQTVRLASKKSIRNYI